MKTTKSHPLTTNLQIYPIFIHRFLLFYKEWAGYFSIKSVSICCLSLKNIDRHFKKPIAIPKSSFQHTTGSTFKI
jgi:hypothetical protein